MTIQRNDLVRAVAGEHRGETGRVIRRPMGNEGITTVTRANGRTFDTRAEWLVVVTVGEGEKVQS